MEDKLDNKPPTYEPEPTPEEWINRRMNKPTHVCVNEGDQWCGIVMNPKVFFCSLAIIWSFIIWSMVDADGSYEETSKWQGWITKQLGWVYVGGINVFFLVCCYLVLSKYGDLRLAKDDDEKPDFSYASWFSMLFSAGIGIGLFFWGVGEPILHYGWVSRVNHNFMQVCTDERIVEDGITTYAGTATSCFTVESRHERAMRAMNIAWYHWGFGASSVYVIVGLPIAYYHYKYGQALTMRTALYPLLGNRVNGWIGDAVEISAIIGTMFGIVTSLGLGVQQIATGLQRMNSDISNEEGGSTQIWIIWGVTIIATISVMTGLEVGIRRISEFTFVIGIFVLAMVLFMDNCWFIIEYFVEEVGFHINHMFETSFAAEGFGMWLHPASTDLINQTGGFSFAGFLETWGGYWTIFYWAWWISWAPFVGLFIARISRGRTIREFVLGNMVVPTILTCVWLCVFGGAGLNQQIQAENAGMTCADCYDDAGAYINGCQMLICRGWSADAMLYDLLERYPMRDFMVFVATLGISLYFVTSSDSASSVIDAMASNGQLEGPIWQRVFWAVTEGATAHAVLHSGGGNALRALRAVSIVAALPFCILMFAMAFTFLRFLKAENDPEFQKAIKDKKEWNINIFDAGAQVVVNTVTLGATGICGDIGDTATALVAGPILQHRAHSEVGGGNPCWLIMFVVAYLLLVIFTICTMADARGAIALTGASWILYVTIGTANRMHIREKLNIGGTCLGDTCTFMWCGPFAIFQEYMAAVKGQIRGWGPNANGLVDTTVKSADKDLYNL